jgi:hypothetical protein
VRFRETCLAVVVVVARVRDEVLYTFFAAPSTPLRSCQTLVLANVRHAPRPLRCPLAGTLLLEGPIRRTRGGSEWEPIKILLKGDRDSNKTNTASTTRLRLTTQVGQAHVATEVPLDLGTNTQPSDTITQRNTKPRVH